VCGAPSAAKALWLHTSDGVRLYAASEGSGSTTVVLAHESPASLCGWLPTMGFLAAHGIRTLAFDFRGFGASGSPRTAIFEHYLPDLQAAVDAVGTTHVIVMGASFGGAVSLADGFRLRGVAGIVSLSGEQKLQSGLIDAIGAAPKLRVPVLIVASRFDRYLDAAQARQLYRRAGSRDKSIAVYPGAFHGWDLVTDAPYHARVRALLLRWLRSHG
jgi:pimeloyl-ACP methyl ester carboxylesterase